MRPPFVFIIPFSSFSAAVSLGQQIGNLILPLTSTAYILTYSSRGRRRSGWGGDGGRGEERNKGGSVAELP